MKPTTVLRAALTITLCVISGGRAGAQAIRVVGDAAVDIGVPARPVGEPMIAINPTNSRHLLGVAIIFDTTAHYRDSLSLRKIQCAAFASMDAGASWTRHDFSVGECFDPWVAITPDGRAVFSAFGREPRLLHQGRSGRFRLLWSDPRNGLFQLRTAVIEVDGIARQPAK